MKLTTFLKAALAIAVGGLSLSCGKSVRTTDHGVIVTTEDGTKVSVEMVTDAIARVRAVPAGAQFSKTESLMAVPLDYTAEYTIEETPETVSITTSSLSVSISRKDGSVSYSDSEGTVYTSEKARSFTPIEVEGTSAYTVHQTFFSPDDEAFFGLGQHQADEWNYKGKNEELFQYNTKISIPFIVSSRRYGILWDSNSFCRWGDIRDYSQLGDVFTLRDADGVEGALTGTYKPFRGETLVRRETSLSQEFLETPDCAVVRNAPEGFNFGGSHVTFTGTLEANESGLFHFYLYYAGYTKVWLGEEEVMPEIWRTAWNPNARKFEYEFTAGEQIPIRIEWEPDGGVSYCGLRVLSPVDGQEDMSWWGEMQEQLDYYFIAGADIDGVISGYRTITGKAQIMPKWSLGYWQSRERYSTQDQVVSTLKEFRDRHIPIDNIVQDWQYWEADQWGSHEFDATRYPDPKGMVDSVHALNGRFMISVWPKFYTNTEHFKELDSRGWMYQTAVRDSVEDWLGYQQSFYDAYAPGARELFWQQMKDHLYPIGVDAWWMDASEPNIHDCTDMDYRKALSGPTALGPSAQYFNAYALMNAQAIYEGQRSTGDNRRVFLLTRNGFAGLQRYSTASWSGDIGTRWEDMKAQISAGLNYSISGIPFWGQDIGGFSVENRYQMAQRIFDMTGQITPDLEEWRELQTRWHEWGVFTPLYRSHGQSPNREPWFIAPEGTETYNTIVETDRLRYKLMPYIYTMAARVHFDDYTIMRPLVMDFLGDSEVINISDEFMFGDAILVCPVYEYKARSREVYLPAGYDWMNINDGKFYDGGTRFEAAAPYSEIPVYLRSGQIIPFGAPVESTAERQTDILVQVIGGQDASYRLYDDNGLNYDYEQGAYSWIPMNWNEAERTLTIGEREGSFEGMPEAYLFTVQVLSKAGNTDPVKVNYNGAEVSVKF